MLIDFTQNIKDIGNWDLTPRANREVWGVQDISACGYFCPQRDRFIENFEEDLNLSFVDEVGKEVFRKGVYVQLFSGSYYPVLTSNKGIFIEKGYHMLRLNKFSNGLINSRRNHMSRDYRYYYGDENPYYLSSEQYNQQTEGCHLEEIIELDVSFDTTSFRSSINVENVCLTFLFEQIRKNLPRDLFLHSDGNILFEYRHTNLYSTCDQLVDLMKTFDEKMNMILPQIEEIWWIE